MLSIDTTEERSTRSIEGRVCYLSKLYPTSARESPNRLADEMLIGGFSKCHGICGNNCEVSSVTNLLAKALTLPEIQLLSLVKIGSSSGPF